MGLAAALLGLAAASYVPLPAGTLSSVLARDTDLEPTRIAAFELRETPVTRTEFRQFLSTHGEWQPDRVPAVFAGPGYLQQGVDEGDAPVTAVSWFAAQAYCEAEVEGGRLPTWHEWEYAAAADATRTDARGDPAWLARILGWYARPADGPLPAVGGAANVYGVRDLHGLVWEWVEDFNALLVNADSRSAGDPDLLKFCGAGAIDLQDRQNYAVLMRVALLSSLGGGDSTGSLGFRCAREVWR
ncbi:formylglycine-generating enzyme family protein [Roseateles sp.]|uniref:formylglycine-generating enzyme family protein n=1 Tax=Roseateles sp. TaxID=1971397 RepID=UPI003266DAF5